MVDSVEKKSAGGLWYLLKRMFGVGFVALP
jgi:hypothetical protein